MCRSFGGEIRRSNDRDKLASIDVTAQRSTSSLGDMSRFGRRRRWVLLAALLFVASALSYPWLLSASGPSWLRESIWRFVDPGDAIWWLTLGGPFQSHPQSFIGVAWAAVANALFWLAIIMFVWRGICIVGGWARRHRS